jgi:hypothetical protein
MKKRVGRPKVGTKIAKSVFISSRFSHAEAGQIEAAAKRSGLHRSKWIRKTLLSAAH